MPAAHQRRGHFASLFYWLLTTVYCLLPHSRRPTRNTGSAARTSQGNPRTVILPPSVNRGHSRRHSPTNSSNRHCAIHSSPYFTRWLTTPLVSSNRNPRSRSRTSVCPYAALLALLIR